MKIVAVIPARGGSKGIPRKNVIDFCGHPLVAWSIAVARQCKMINAVYVSTDSPEIADVARRYGACVINRPEQLSGDTSASESSLIHACQVIEAEQQLKPEIVVFLQATSPLRESSELDGALQKLLAEGLDSLFAASQPEDMLFWLEEESSLRSFNYDYRSRTRRQDVSDKTRIWFETGSFYITKAEFLIQSQNRLGGKIGIWPVSFWKSFEIDSIEGMILCAALMKQYGLDKNSPEPVAVQTDAGQ